MAEQYMYGLEMSIFAYLLGTIYAVLGILVLFQNKVMEKWKNKRLEIGNWNLQLFLYL